MSYIRCLSNPEGLYIWGDISGDAIIAGGPDREPGMAEPDNLRRMPIDLWEKLLETWTKNWYLDVDLAMVIDGVKHEVSLTERLHPASTLGDIFPCFGAVERGGADAADEIEPGRMKVCISYKNDRDEKEAWELDDIWPVTMHYIAKRHDTPYFKAGWLKRQMLRLLGV